MKIVVVNNYKEPEKAKQALDNLTRCVEHQLEMIDYKSQDILDRISKQDPDAAILTGSNFMLSKSDTRLVFDSQMDLVRKLEVPILGICFGHQLIGAAFGSEIVDMGKNVRAFKEVKVISKDPIFDGLPPTISVAESHRQTISQRPTGFRHLAHSATS